MFLQYQSTSNWTPQGEIESFKFADDMYYLLLNLWRFLLSLWVTHLFLQLYLLHENMITLWHTCLKKFSKNSKKNICDRCFSKKFLKIFRTAFWKNTADASDFVWLFDYSSIISRTQNGSKRLYILKQTPPPPTKN